MNSHASGATLVLATKSRPCDSMPCLNDGECTNVDSEWEDFDSGSGSGSGIIYREEYECTCTGYTGERCELSDAETALSEDISAGTTEVVVSERFQAAAEVGDSITFSSGTDIEETVTIVGFGSILFEPALVNNHESGATLVGTQNTITATSLAQLLSTPEFMREFIVLSDHLGLQSPELVKTFELLVAASSSPTTTKEASTEEASTEEAGNDTASAVSASLACTFLAAAVALF
jgi:hypothetical protein